MMRMDKEKGALRDRRIGKILAILREAEAVPRTWSKGTDAWKRRVALKHGVALQSIYRWRAKYNERGISGLQHRKSNVGPRVWGLDALNWWLGLCLKPQKREMTLKALFEDFLLEVQRRGWRAGSYRSGRWWLEQKSSSLMRILP